MYELSETEVEVLLKRLKHMQDCGWRVADKIKCDKENYDVLAGYLMATIDIYELIKGDERAYKMAMNKILDTLEKQ